MRKFLLLMIALLAGVSGVWATSYYFVGGRTSASDLTTGKKYMIYNTAYNGTYPRQWFLRAASSSAYGVTYKTSPLTFTTTDASYIWTLEEGSTSGTYKIKNVGTSTYSAGGTSLGSAVDYTIGEYTTCPAKTDTPSTNDDGTQTAIADLTSSDKGFYIVQNGTTAYWNGNQNALATWSNAHVYAIYEVVEIEDGGCYTIDFESNDGSKFWAVSTSGTSVSVAQQTSAAQGSVFVAHAYVNAQGQQRWMFVNNTDGYFLAYKEATATFNHEKPINEFSVAAIYKNLNGNVTTDNCNGKVYMITDNRSTTSTSKGCYILNETTNAFDTSDSPFYKTGTPNYTSAIRITPNAATASATATLAIAKFNALYQVKDVVACASNMSAIFGDPGTLVADINAAATAEAANTLATNYMKSAEGKKFYAVNNTATGQYMNIGTSVVSATSTELTAEAVMELEYAGNGKYYLKGVKSEKYAGAPGNPPSTYSTKGDATAFYIGNYANATDNKVYFAITKANSNGEALHYNSDYTTYVTNWKYSTDPSQWNITAVSDEEYDILANVSAVTYNVILTANGTVKATTTKDVRKGHDLVLPSEIAKDYCTYTYYSDAACTSPISVVPDASTTTVYALASYTMPFTVSSDFASATWDLLQMRQGGYNVKYVADAAYYPLVDKSLMTTEDDAYLWAFIGNPYDGFEIVNKSAGSTKKLYAGASPANGGYPLMSSENTTKWLVNGSPKNSEVGGFGLQVPGQSMYINDYSGNKKLSFWQQSTSVDEGSTLTVAKQYPLLVVNNISPYFNSVGQLFSLKSNEATVSMGSTWAAAVGTCSKATYDDLVSFVTDPENIRFPESGFYRIKNKSSNKYVGYGAAGYSGKGTGLIEVEANNLSSILYLNKVSDGVYKISTQGLNAQVQSEDNVPVRATAETGANHTFSVLTAQVVSIRADLEDSNGYWFRSSWGSAPESIITWEVYSDVAKWSVEAASTVDISLTPANDNTGTAQTYATLCVPFSITGLAGVSSKEVKAYAPTKSGNYIVPGDGATTVTEGTPVILIGEEGATSVTATIGSNYASSPATTNVLTGTFTGTTIDCTAETGTNYVLGFDSTNGNRIGFYHVANEEFPLSANRAYLHVDKGGGSVKGFAINWDELVDGINTVQGSGFTVQDSAIYNLAGQRMSKLQRGVNIVNGKKVMVK